MKRKLRVAVIFGGQSGEHEVSLASATSVLAALDKKKYEVLPVGISKKGTWITNGDPLRRLKTNSAQSLTTDAILSPDASKQRLVSLRARRTTPRILKKLDVIFPVLHGTHGEDGTIQGLFELANIPFVGSGVVGSAVAMDKVIQKQLCQQVGLPVVRYLSIPAKQYRTNKSDWHKKIAQLGLPVFVKPANLGSSVGISKVSSNSQLTKAIQLAFAFDEKIIVEQGIEDAHEIEVAILGNENPQASVPGEIVSSNAFYDYNAKYVDNKSIDNIPAPLPKSVLQKIQKIAIQAFIACECRGMARIDFLVTKKDHKIYLNEINTIPGFTQISMYPKLWEASGVPYTKLLDTLITLAIERHQTASRRKTSYQPKEKWY